MRASRSARSDPGGSARPRPPRRGLPPLLLAGAVAYFVAHAPHLARSLEDIDSINFALGLRQFDVAAHQPHPPGYPVYIALGRAMAWVVGAVYPSAQPPALAAVSLSLLSALSGAVAVAALGLLFAALDGMAPLQTRPRWGWATALVAASPLFWISSLRPMSDIVGLSLASLALALMLRAGPASGLALSLGAGLAGLAGGVRVQTALVTLPVLALVLWPYRTRVAIVVRTLCALCAGGMLWAVPLVWLSGGPAGYLSTLGSQAGEDFAWVDMLWANPAPRRVALALVDTFVRPWSVPGLAMVVGVLACGGLVIALLRERRALGVVAAAFLPYAAFHLLLQETSHVRYALPLVVPVGWLASRALASLGPLGRVVAAIVVATSLYQALSASMLYASQAHPAFRVIADMTREAEASPPGAVFAHYALYRSLQAAAPALPLVAPVRDQEWLGPVDYWRNGGQGVVWFLADPKRTDLDLFDPRALSVDQPYPWDVGRRAEWGGARPGGALWYRMSSPAWMVGRGWSLTPEAGGRVRAEGTGPHRRPIEAYVRRRSGPLAILVGGYYLGPQDGPASRVVLTLDGTVIEDWTHDHRGAGLSFLRVVRLPDGLPTGAGAYATLSLGVTAIGGGPAGEMAIRQFDVQGAAGSMMGFGSGWYEDEYDTATGLRWRWSSDHAELFVMADAGTTLVIRGESPLKYFGDAPQVRLSIGDRTLAEFVPREAIDWRVPIPAGALPLGGGTVTLSLDRAYLPGPSEGTSDTRKLGIRTFSTRLESAK